MGTLLPCLQKINLSLQQSSLFSLASMVFVRTNANFIKKRHLLKMTFLYFWGKPQSPFLKKIISKIATRIFFHRYFLTTIIDFYFVH